jgi:5-methylcytosine-specific restriction endonuclease McrA
MPWFLVDDGFYSHPFTLRVLATEPAALGLWAAAGSWSSRHLTDGVVPDPGLPLLFPGAVQLAPALVTGGLWKRRRGEHLIVQGDGICKIPSSKTVMDGRAAGARRQALFRDPGLKKAVRDRDGDSCRYCGRRVRWGKGRASDSATYSHLDPYGVNVLDNIVTACFTCATAKGTQTLAESGLRLVRPGQNLSRNGIRNATTKGSQEGAHTDTDKPPYPPQHRPGAPPPDGPGPRKDDPVRTADLIASLRSDLAAKAPG